MFGHLEGNFNSPFRSDLFFGKLTALPNDTSSVDVSFSRRKETDIQNFGGTRSYEVAENKKNKIDTVLGKWTYRGDRFLNELSIDYLNYNYNPTALDQSSPTFEYQGIITYGGREGTQDIKQRAITFRDDVTIPNVELAGNHTFKAGIKYSRQKYDFVKVFYLQPWYLFQGPDYSFPREAKLGLGDPSYDAKNNLFGVFVQDDWDVTDKLQLNLGIRWDRESNMFNNKYVTPTNAAAVLRALGPTNNFDAEDYITDGNDRPVYDMIQPRLGFSYDVNDDQRTVIFGGFGRYYDRNVFNNTLDERYRQQYLIGNFRFSSDGLTPGTVMWNPAYLTREGLLALQATATTGFPELFAVKNNAKPPRTDQFSLGVRQRFGRDWSASATVSSIRGKNGYTHYFGNRTNGGTGGCCDGSVSNALGYGNVLIGADDLKTRYKALYLTLDKNYTVASGWGLNVAYTLQKAEQNGGDLFSLDKYTAADYGFRDKAGVERHSLVVSGLLDLPWGVKFSTLSKFGSGEAFQIFESNIQPLFHPATNQIYSGFPKKNCLGFLARCEVDVTLEKEFTLFSGHTLSVAADIFNLFNNKNYAGFDGFFCCGETRETGRIGVPDRLLTLPRRLQFRAAYRF
jgi:outer membrane receptor protein involved in Fe transport